MSHLRGQRFSLRLKYQLQHETVMTYLVMYPLPNFVQFHHNITEKRYYRVIMLQADHENVRSHKKMLILFTCAVKMYKIKQVLLSLCTVYIYYAFM